MSATKTQAGSISLNWLKGEPQGFQVIQQQANLAIEVEALRIKRVSRYIDSQVNLTDEWKASVQLPNFVTGHQPGNPADRGYTPAADQHIRHVG